MFYSSKSLLLNKLFLCLFIYFSIVGQRSGATLSPYITRKFSSTSAQEKNVLRGCVVCPPACFLSWFFHFRQPLFREKNCSLTEQVYFREVEKEAEKRDRLVWEIFHNHGSISLTRKRYVHSRRCCRGNSIFQESSGARKIFSFPLLLSLFLSRSSFPLVWDDKISRARNRFNLYAMRADLMSCVRTRCLLRLLWHVFMKICGFVWYHYSVISLWSIFCLYSLVFVETFLIFGDKWLGT